MRKFFSTLPHNILACFKGRWIIGHLLAIGLTLIIVSTDSDWRYFSATRNPIFFSSAFPAAPIGMLFPVALPLALFLLGILSKDAKATLAGWAIGQAELIGSLI